MEANHKVPEAPTGTTDDRNPKDTPTTAQEFSGQQESDTEDQGEQRPPEIREIETTPPDSTEQTPYSPSDSLEQRPSYGNFANLSEEFEARAQSTAIEPSARPSSNRTHNTRPQRRQRPASDTSTTSRGSRPFIYSFVRTREMPYTYAVLDALPRPRGCTPHAYSLEVGQRASR